jgi:periplasmic divalent cation tolerance protein
VKKKPFIVIFITCSGDNEAKKIADTLLTRKNAACVNILPRVRSLFWWQGKIDSADEVLLIAKTESRLLDDVVKLVKKLHSYDVPEIIAMPIAGGNSDYLKWIDKTTKA